jgi:hypothetical protein
VFNLSKKALIGLKNGSTFTLDDLNMVEEGRDMVTFDAGEEVLTVLTSKLMFIYTRNNESVTLH